MNQDMSLIFNIAGGILLGAALFSVCFLLAILIENICEKVGDKISEFLYELKEKKRKMIDKYKLSHPEKYYMTEEEFKAKLNGDTK